MTLAQIREKRLCAFCEHFYFDGGTKGCSNYTPGSSGHLSCNKGHIGEGMEDMSLREFREIMLKGETCSDYKLPDETTL